jgi:hypothetical protein
VAHKGRKKKRGWLRAVVLFVFVPFFVWALAFFVWFNWNNISNLLHSDTRGPTAKETKRVEKPTTGSEDSPKEKILDQDRRQLEEILKRH